MQSQFYEKKLFSSKRAWTTLIHITFIKGKMVFRDFTIVSFKGLPSR